MIRHIWFDMGGTLYRETAAFDAVHDKLRYEAFAEVTGTPIEEAESKYQELYARYGSNSAVFTSLGKPSDFWQNTFDNMDLSAVLDADPAVNQTLIELSRYVPISLFTNFKPTKIESVLKLLGINHDIFTHVLSGDDVTKRKPDPEGFDKMVELTGVPPDELLYVGDRIDVDIKPARAIGIKTALLWQSSDEADYSIRDFLELPQVLKPELGGLQSQ